MQVYILAFIIALLASWVLTPYVKKLAFRIGALDKPDGRKVHHGIMPRLGGLAIYLAFVIAVLATMHMTRDIFALLLGGTVIVIVGILDDKYQLPAKVKLLGQIAAAFVLVLFDIKIEWLNNPWGGYFYLEYFSVPLTVFWIVSFTNVVNLMDGLDGLAAGVSGIASVTVILVALQQGFYPVAVITAALAGGIIGFIRYNFNPASIFMGDTGSMFIGYMLAAISIFGAVKSAATIACRCAWPAYYGYRLCHCAPLHQRTPDFSARQGASAPPPAGDGPQPAPGSAFNVCYQRSAGHCRYFAYRS